MIFPAEFESSPPLSGRMGPIYHIRGKNKRRQKKPCGAKIMAKTVAKTVAKTMGQTKIKYNIVVNAG